MRFFDSGPAPQRSNGVGTLVALALGVVLTVAILADLGLVRF